MVRGAESSQAHDFVEDALGDFGLAKLRQRQIAAIAGEQGDDICVVVEAGAFGGDVVGDDKIGVLCDELFAGIFRDVVRFGGEANDDCSTFVSASFGENIRRWLEMNVRAALCSALFFLRRFRPGGSRRRRRQKWRWWTSGNRSVTARCISLAERTSTRSTPGRRFEIDGAAYQNTSAPRRAAASATA